MDADRPVSGLTIVRRSLPALIGPLLFCLLMAAAAGSAFANEHGMPAVNAPEAPAEPGDDEDEDDAETGDGSEALTGTRGLVVPPDLDPIGVAEEEALLGDWGDSADEDED